MATDIVITTSAYTTTDMKPATGEAVGVEWGQNIAENTGFNNHGYTNKPLSCWGRKTVDISDTGDQTTVTFSTDNIDGAETFNGDYCVQLTYVERTANQDQYALAVVTRNATNFIIEVTADIAVTETEVDVNYFVIGY